MSVWKPTNLVKRHTLHLGPFLGLGYNLISDLDLLNLQTNKKPEQITLSIHFFGPFLDTFCFSPKLQPKPKNGPKRLVLCKVFK